MLPCDKPERPKKVYTIPKVSKKRQAEIDNGTFKPKPKKRIKVNADYKIPARSKRRAAQEREYYNKTRPEYLKTNPVCQARIKCLGNEATEVHHKEGRIESRLNDVNTFIGLCNECHKWAEINVNAAKALGISNNRL